MIHPRWPGSQNSGVVSSSHSPLHLPALREDELRDEPFPATATNYRLYIKNQSTRNQRPTRSSVVGGFFSVVMVESSDNDNMNYSIFLLHSAKAATILESDIYIYNSDTVRLLLCGSRALDSTTRYGIKAVVVVVVLVCGWFASRRTPR